MKLSVVIPTYNNTQLAVVHARECMNVSRIPDEIIVVNDGGDPDLLDELRKLDFKCRFVYARINEDILWNYNGACNLGAFLSTGDVLAFEDTDNIPTLDFYEKGLKFLEENPEIGRITARVRHIVPLEQILTKPKSEWVIKNVIGPNQGTAIIRRDIFTLCKGQDERFCGEYGWMYPNFKRVLLNRAKTLFGSVGAYYFTDEGQSKLSRSMSQRNYSLLNKGSRDNTLQSPFGIINFTYSMQVL